MGVLTNKIQELDRLEKQYKRERERIMQTISDTVRSVGQNPAIKPLGKRMFIIPMSELINSPWSPEFHDWNVQADRLLTLLGKKPVQEWLTFIRELLNKNARSDWTGITVDKTLLSKKFLQQVVDRL